MENKIVDLCKYRMNNAKDTLDTAKLCMEHQHYRDTVNRCYYAAFYAVKAVLALEEIDFKRHKDAIAHFNKNYVAPGIFERDLGRLLGRLKQKRGAGAYDDFYVVSHDEALLQYKAAEQIINSIRQYLKNKGI